jgi:hypothetical protein
MLGLGNRASRTVGQIGNGGHARTSARTGAILKRKKTGTKSPKYAVQAIAFSDCEGIIGQFSGFFEIRHFPPGFLHSVLS